jgi:hypothetical protein
VCVLSLVSLLPRLKYCQICFPVFSVVAAVGGATRDTIDSRQETTTGLPL